ncbi:transaldolase family protein, partial [Psychrobacter sp. 1U2]
MSALQQLSTMTTIVADTGDLAAIARLKPIDATTNPSLITKALMNSDNQTLLLETMSQHQGNVDAVIDALTIQIGCDILELIEGRVSTEVDARLSYDTQATIDKALEFMDAYQKAGINSERILIKMAATWQGIEAARYLETQGIHCNLTLLFGQHQAVACADAGVTLISPFVGRILDWQKRQQNRQNVPVSDDMGVQS